MSILGAALFCLPQRGYNFKLLVMIGLIKKVRSEQKLKEVAYEVTLMESIMERGNNQCQDPEAVMFLVC